MVKSKWKYLRDELLMSLILTPCIWMLLDSAFIFKHDYMIYIITILWWLILSINEANIQMLKDRLKDLEEKEQLRVEREEYQPFM
jgi:hypothetical protein